MMLQARWTAAILLGIVNVCYGISWDFANLADTLGPMYEFKDHEIAGKVFAVIGEAAADQEPLRQIARHLSYPLLCVDLAAGLKQSLTPAEVATDIKRWLVDNLIQPSIVSVTNAELVDGSSLEALNFLHEVTDFSNSMVHYTNPTTLKTSAVSTKGSIFVLHFTVPSSDQCHKSEIPRLWDNAVAHRASPDALYGRIGQTFCATDTRSTAWIGSCDRIYPSSGPYSTTRQATSVIAVVAAVGLAVIISSAFSTPSTTVHRKPRDDAYVHTIATHDDGADEVTEVQEETQAAGVEHLAPTPETPKKTVPNSDRVTRSQTKKKRKTT